MYMVHQIANAAAATATMPTLTGMQHAQAMQIEAHAVQQITPVNLAPVANRPGIPADQLLVAPRQTCNEERPHIHDIGMAWPTVSRPQCPSWLRKPKGGIPAHGAPRVHAILGSQDTEGYAKAQRSTGSTLPHTQSVSLKECQQTWCTPVVKLRAATVAHTHANTNTHTCAGSSHLA